MMNSVPVISDLNKQPKEVLSEQLLKLIEKDYSTFFMNHFHLFTFYGILSNCLRGVA